MNVSQLSVFVENKPGHLQKVLKNLAENNINIITLTIAETSDFGILRMIVNDTATAIASLKKESIACSTTEVLAIEIDDEPGALFKAVDTFTKRKLNIEYMYAFNEKINNRCVMIFRFDNIETAKTALTEEGYRIVRKQDINGE